MATPMLTLTLPRIKHTTFATFGEFRDPEGRHLCFALERPWLDNQHGISCIPAGTYLVRRRWSPKHQANVWGLIDVPNRDDIEIHPANDARELEGCIAPGTEIGEVTTPAFGDGYGVRHSVDALALLDAAIGATEEWTLIIQDAPGQEAPSQEAPSDAPPR